MLELTLANVERHWAGISQQFRVEYQRWITVYSTLLETSGGILKQFEGRRRLPENCCYLLLSKAVNHSLSMYTLANRGLLIDAAFSGRNALETLLLLQVCTLDPSEKLFERWANGERFQPIWVRRKLENLSEVRVRGIIVSCPKPDDTYSFAYKWLSEITHANVGSTSYSMRPKGEHGYEVIVGGDIRDAQVMINALFAVVGSTLLFTGILCASVFSLEWAEENKEKLSRLQKEIDTISKSYMSKGT